MRDSVLFCDTNCELWHDVAEKLDLNVIKMPYVLDGEEFYYDLGKATDFKQFYSRIRAGSLPTTSALNAFNYVEYFEPFLKEGKDILYISFSHKLSGTFDFMNDAIRQLKEKYPNQRVICFDTKSISLGAGIQVYYAGKMKSEGASDDEILEFLQKFRDETATYFIVDDLYHLKRGGRLSTFKAVVGTVLGFKPVIKVLDDGSLSHVGKVKGAKKIIDELVRVVDEQSKDLDKYDIWVVHGDCPAVAKNLKTKLIEKFGDKITVHSQIIGPVIATHCGQGAIGVIFSAKQR